MGVAETKTLFHSFTFISVANTLESALLVRSKLLCTLIKTEKELIKNAASIEFTTRKCVGLSTKISLVEDCRRFYRVLGGKLILVFI